MSPERINYQEPYERRAFPHTQKALLQHLPTSGSLAAVQCFVQFDDQWIEAARLGNPPDYEIERLLRDFDPSSGGLIEALPDNKGWLGRYWTQALDRPICFVMHFALVEADRLTELLQRIETHLGWVSLAVLADCQEEATLRIEDSEFVTELVLASTRAPSRAKLAQQWIASVERVLQADTVAVLWRNGQSLSLAAISGGGTVQRRSDVRTHLETLGRQALSANAPLFLGTEDALLNQTGLSALGMNHLALFPVRAGEQQQIEAVVAAGFETTPSAQVARGAPWVLDALSQSLDVQQRTHLPTIGRLSRSLGDAFSDVVGPRLWRLKLALLLLLILVGWAHFTPMQATPAFVARVEAQQKQVISAPFDGFIQEAPRRLGDRVSAGSVLLTLDTSETRLELTRQEAELAEVQLELQTARGRRDAAQVRRLSARESQLAIVIQLLQTQLANSVKTAAEDSVVLGGDAWQRVGDRVRLGEPLMEVASAEDLRVLAFIDEDWVTELSVGVPARMQLAAYPDRSFSGEVESIGTDTRALEGINTFPVWISLPESMRALVLDGMRGVARVQLGQTTVLAYYTRGIRRWIARQWWRWSPA